LNLLLQYLVKKVFLNIVIKLCSSSYIVGMCCISQQFKIMLTQVIEEHNNQQFNHLKHHKDFLKLGIFSGGLSNFFERKNVLHLT
jgi:hypothetical protein